MKSRYCVSKANCVAVDNVGKCVCPDDMQGDGETNGTGCYNGKSVRYRSMLLGPNNTNPWIYAVQLHVVMTMLQIYTCVLCNDDAVEMNVSVDVCHTTQLITCVSAIGLAKCAEGSYQHGDHCYVVIVAPHYTYDDAVQVSR